MGSVAGRVNGAGPASIGCMRGGTMTAVTVIAACCFCAATAAASDPVAPPLPANLQALVAKMRLLQVNSERYSEVSRGYIRVANRSNGRIVGRVRYVRENFQLTGVASLTPQRSETFFGPKHAPRRIVIGQNIYFHVDGKRRRWVRRREPDSARAFAAYPFHGEPDENDLGGTGSYAGLLNLLATAVGPIVNGTPTVIGGQRTEVLSATVQPLRLVKGLTEANQNSLGPNPVLEQVEVFLTEAGVPIRVVETLHADEVHLTLASEILAVNMPVDVKTPPARQTG